MTASRKAAAPSHPGQLVGSAALVRDYAALVALIDSRLAMPHEWGREANDCVAFALAAVEAQTGIRPAAKLHWTDRRSGLRVIAAHGPLLPDPSDPTAVGGLEAAFDAYFDRVSPALAKRGDIAGVPDPELGIHPMIVEGATLVCPSDRGNHRVPRSAMTIAWSAESARANKRKKPLAPFPDRRR